MLDTRKRLLSDVEDVDEKPDGSPEAKKRKVDDESTPATSSSTVETITESSAESGPATPPDEDIHVTSVDKGKGVDRSLVAPVVTDAEGGELERLRAELAAKTALLEKHEKRHNALQQLVVCQICLEHFDAPYALSCGHVMCYHCLMQWWTTTRDDENRIDEPRHVNYLSDGPSDDEAANPPPPGDSNAVAGPSNQGPRAYPNALRRKKICPACRAVILRRPVQVYLVKNLLNLVVDTLTPREPPPPIDPWQGVFESDRTLERRRREDPDAFAEEFETDDELWNPDEDILGVYQNPWGPNGPVLPPPPGVRAQQNNGNQPPPFNDLEDGVLRCGLCMHELWDGTCTNEECQAHYDHYDHDDFSDDVSDSGHSVDSPPGPLSEDDDDNDDDNPDWVGGGRSRVDDGEDDSDSYDGSFIDDSGLPSASISAERISRHPFRVDDEEGDLGGGRSLVAAMNPFMQVAGPGPSIRRAQRRQQNRRRNGQDVIIDSSGDENEADPSRPLSGTGSREDAIVVPSDDEDGVPGPSNRNRRNAGRGRIESEDEDGESDAPVLTTRVRRGRVGITRVNSDSAEEEHVVNAVTSHSDDSDNERRSLRDILRRSREDEEDEEDGYRGEYVPYAWEEDDGDGHSDVSRGYDDDDEFAGFGNGVYYDDSDGGASDIDYA